MGHVTPRRSHAPSAPFFADRKIDVIPAAQFPPTPSVADTLAAYRSGRTDPGAVVADALELIRERDPLVRAFVHVDDDGARRAADAASRRWRDGTARPLEGVPIGVKDVEADASTPPRFGFAEPGDDVPPSADSPSIRALRRAGAIIVGKTTTPQVGWRATTDAPGTPPTRNPHDLAMTAGGSSGGSAAAVAAGMIPAALGTDGGGSVRIPASFCGVVGFKPTYGRIPQWPASGVGSLGHTGPIAQNVADAGLLFDVLSTFDPRDGAAVPERAPTADDLNRMPRIAVSLDLGFVDFVDPEVVTLTRRAADRFADLGFEVEEASPPLGDPSALFQTLWDTSFATITSTLAPNWAAAIEPGLREVAERGSRVTAVQLASAEMKRIQLAGIMASFHERWDYLLTPTLPIPAFTAGRIVPAGGSGSWTEWTPFTWPFNLTQQPALSVPAGVTGAGLPVGVQLVGPRFSDRDVLRAGEVLERALA